MLRFNFFVSCNIAYSFFLILQAGLNMQHDEELIKPFCDYMYAIKGENNSRKYINAVARYLFFCNSNEVDWNFIGKAKKIEEYIHYWLKKTTAQAKTLSNYLDAIVFASKFVDVHMDVPILKVESTVFSLKKMLNGLTHAREAYIEEKMNDLPSYSEVSKMRDDRYIQQFKEYANSIDGTDSKEMNEDAKIVKNQRTDWCTDWLACTVCLDSMQRPGKCHLWNDKDILYFHVCLQIMCCFILYTLLSGAVQNIKMSEYDKGKKKIIFGVHVLEASKHKTSRKGKAGLVLDELLMEMLELYLEKVRPTIPGASESPYVFLTCKGLQLSKLSQKMYKVTFIVRLSKSIQSFFSSFI